MRSRITWLAALAVVAAACGPDQPGAVGGGPRQAPSAVVPVTTARDVAPPEQHDATPEPIVEPSFKPVPDPAPVPALKPARPGPPTPPPPRTRSFGPVDEPAIPDVPPALDLQPGSAISRDDFRVAAAISDLAVRLERDPAGIDVLDARDVTWRDGSVGCPVPGLAYSQALEPGFLVVLRSGDTSYRYHAAGDQIPFFCASPQAPREGGA